MNDIRITNAQVVSTRKPANFEEEVLEAIGGDDVGRLQNLLSSKIRTLSNECFAYFLKGSLLQERSGCVRCLVVNADKKQASDSLADLLKRASITGRSDLVEFLLDEFKSRITAPDLNIAYRLTFDPNFQRVFCREIREDFSNPSTELAAQQHVCQQLFLDKINRELPNSTKSSSCILM